MTPRIDAECLGRSASARVLPTQVATHENPPHARVMINVCALALLAAVVGCTRDDALPLSLGAPLELALATADGSGQPHLATTPDGEAVLSWLEPSAAGNALKVATLTNDGWSDPRTVTEGEGWFVNWADFPSVVPISSELWAAHWLVMPPGSYHAYDIMMSISADAGLTWGQAFQLHEDDTETEHGFVSLFSWAGDIGAVWLDGRALADVDHDAGLDPDAPPVGMALRFARLDEQGAFLERGEIDALVCDCCQTDVAVAAGEPVLVYRDRTASEIRDIVARTADTAWSDPVPLGPDHWYLEGCPVNGPAAAARDHTVAVAWFTAAREQPRVRLAYSSDGGRSFEAPIEVDGTGAFGHVGIVLLEDGDAIVSWWRRSRATQGSTLAARRVSRDGTLGATHAITESSNLRPIDVPQMVLSENRLVFAWTDANHGVRTAVSPLLR